MQDDLHAIGIMTGNSLDGADLVLTRFGPRGEIADLAAHSVDFAEGLRAGLRAIRGAVDAARGDVRAAVVTLGLAEFERTFRAYMDLVVGAVEDLRAKAPEVAVDLIGLHGQTCAHRPPSIAGRDRPDDTYTVQLGDGQELADRSGVAVVYDFRSDDLILGGEGAPLAPMHHRHLADLLQRRGIGPVAFANAGNTGNVSLIAAVPGADAPTVLGWDAGPFNHFPDLLMRREADRPCDRDGMLGRTGSVHLGLLRLLWEQAVVTGTGANFLHQPPPRSSDPQWYRSIPALLGEAPVDGGIVPLADRVRTATYFGPSTLAHSLGLIPATVPTPTHLLVSGGGWRNPLTVPDLRALLGSTSGDRAPILPEHAAHFSSLQQRWGGVAVVDSGALGFDGTAMEARIFADAAVARVRGEAFTTPATTGATRPAVCGLIRFPGGNRGRATPALRATLDRLDRLDDEVDLPGTDPRWSRATAGWAARRRGESPPPPDVERC